MTNKHVKRFSLLGLNDYQNIATMLFCHESEKLVLLMILL